MSDSKWTAEQLAAITEKGCNLLVAAAAGAGKTAVLVERIIRKITDEKDPLDIDRLLVVTFTNAAATEMRERVGNAIDKALEKNPSSRQLQKQLMLLNRASITTIHSFCLEVIRNNFHYIDLDPGFRIADETEAVLMKMEALEELFEEKYETDATDEEFLQLVECYGGGKDDTLLQDMVLGLYEFVQSSPWPEKWLEENAEAFNIPDDADFGVTRWAGILLRSIAIELSGLLNLTERALRIIHSGEGLAPYQGALQEDLSNIKALLNLCCDKQCKEGLWDRLYNAFNSLEFGKLARCSKDADNAKQEQVKALRDEVKKRIKKIREDVFAFKSVEIVRDLRVMYPLMKCLSGLVKEFGERYSAKKREKSLLDFNDLEHYCLKILTVEGEDGGIIPSRAAFAFRERFEEILVDEYQDSNQVQEVILGMISRKDSPIPNVFMVGDVKQSIYRFRQAKPELFLEKYNTYSLNAGALNRKVQLYKNFRSREEVVNCVNYIFKQIMSVSIGELDYNDEEALNLGAFYETLEEAQGFTGGPAELHIIDTGGAASLDDEAGGDEIEAGADVDGSMTEDAELETEDPDSMQCEARIAAKRIRELMIPDSEGRFFKVYDRSINGYRKVEYRDIVILLRATRNWADVYVEELGSYGIPAYADSGTGYFKTIEVQVVMSLLQVIDNPMQDIPLLSVLRSPIASFTPEELIDIRLSDRETSLYEAMKKLAAESVTSTEVKAGKFLGKLAEWRNKARYMSTDELVWYLYTDTGYFSYAGAMPGGVQRQANLRVLFQRARQYEETSYKGLFNFINFINKLKAGKGDMGSAKILGENENVVRIMSIHKSKGLEFPVVIAAGCGKQFNLMDMNRSILLHQDLGFGPDFVDYKRRLSYPTVPKQALRYKTRIESLSEEMRILYVAFTRAREKLIITGSVRNAGKSLEKWAGSLQVPGHKLPEFEMLKARNYLDWIGPALMRHYKCDDLRKLAGYNADFEMPLESCLEDASRWNIKIWGKSDVIRGESQENGEAENPLEYLRQLDLSACDSPYGEDISSRLGWKYRYSMYSKLPAKVSVTELKRRFNSQEDEADGAYVPALVKKPLFMEEIKGLSPAERGTAVHFVMQHLNISQVPNRSEILRQLEEMIAGEFLTEQQARAVDIGKIERFFKSDLGLRLLKSSQVHREVPFNIELKCREINKELEDYPSDDETVLLQGVIDCYFEEEDGLILLDYKTDYIDQEGSSAIIERYRVQMDYYTRALESITGRRVKEKYIYLFWNGEIIRY